MTLSAPGTEAFKQDFAKWEDLRRAGDDGARPRGVVAVEEAAGAGGRKIGSPPASRTRRRRSIRTRSTATSRRWRRRRSRDLRVSPAVVARRRAGRGRGGAGVSCLPAAARAVDARPARRADRPARDRARRDRALPLPSHRAAAAGERPRRGGARAGGRLAQHAPARRRRPVAARARDRAPSKPSSCPRSRGSSGRRCTASARVSRPPTSTR